MNKYTKATFPKFAIAAGAALCAVAAAAFEAALTDPLAWLYADSKIATAERLDEIDVPANGVVDVNILVNGLKPGIRTVDAVEEPSFAGALDVWCPKVNSFERYHALYDSFRTNFGDRVWCYTCCVPGGKCSPHCARVP